MKLIVGLGNPGKRYAKTRHNVGFMVIDALQRKLRDYDITQLKLSKKFNAEIAGATIAGNKILLAKPMTFMNNSGESVQMLAHYYKVGAPDLIVVHDDKDIPLGEIKVQSEKGHAGHNGIRSIMDHIGTRGFMRIRVGIALKNERRMRDTAKFVLGKFGIFEKKQLSNSIAEAVDIIIKELGI